MPAILTNELRIQNSDIFKQSLISVPTYAFIAKQSNWSNEANPPTPIDSTSDKYFTLRELFGMKRVLSTNILSVLPRINWEGGLVYDQYNDKVDLINGVNPNTGAHYKFYVITTDLNVYKCIDNNYGAESVVKPSGTQTSTFQTADGYIWKYMYTVSQSDAVDFMTTNWMPCYTLLSNDGSDQWFSQQSAKPGSIESILLTDVGSGYSIQNPPTVTITGDGTGAVASADVNPVTGEIRRINVTNSGQHYTQAMVTISGTGQNATAQAIISPIKGHGSDPRVELGANYLMVKVVLEGDEEGELDINTSYRITGLISKPLSNDDGILMKLGTNEAKQYIISDTIEGDSSHARGEIVLIDYDEDLVYLKNVSGNFVPNETTTDGNTVENITDTKIPMTQLVDNGENFNKSTGNILFFSNREKINRIENQKEEIISVLSF